MKLLVGADMDSGSARVLQGATAANASDVTRAHHLLAGDGKATFGDPGHKGGQKSPTANAAYAFVWDMALWPRGAASAGLETTAG
jgi:hypothetical protein